jgi:hypothetical protein
VKLLWQEGEMLELGKAIEITMTGLRSMMTSGKAPGGSRVGRTM